MNKTRDYTDGSHVHAHKVQSVPYTMIDTTIN